MEYVQFIGGLALLIISAKFLVKGGVSIAKYFKIPSLVIGLTIVAIGTSAPELIVSVTAAFSGNPEIALGNVVGSNIINIALILAITAMLVPIPVNINSVRLDWPIMMLASVLVYVFLLNNKLELYEGLIFMILLISYIFILIKNSKKEPLHPVQLPEDNTIEAKSTGIWLSIAFIIASSLGLAYGANFLVDGASTIAANFGVSQRVISLTIVAIGTSAPELTASIVAGLKKETDIAIGNIMGSNIFNIFLVLGSSILVSEIQVDQVTFSFDIIWMMFIAVLLFLFIYPFKTVYLNRAEGFILFLAFLVYTYMLLFGHDFESILNTFANLYNIHLPGNTI
jgi:cation:H+ antiporter